MKCLMAMSCLLKLEDIHLIIEGLKNHEISVASELGADYYYSSVIGLTADNSSSTKNIRIDNWRPDIGPRVINVDKETYRYLIGIRGSTDSDGIGSQLIYTLKLNQKYDSK